MHRNTLIIALALALGAAPSLATAGSPTLELSDGWSATLGGQLRARWILDSGRDLLPGDFVEREYVTQRARLTLGLANSAGLAFKLQLQDTRLWGEEADTLNDASAAGLDLHQAYAELPLFEGARLRFGRQEIIFDDHRLVGNVGWTQRARSFDGARVVYSAGALSADLFYAQLVEADRDLDGAVPPARTGEVGFGGLHVNYSAEGLPTLVGALYTQSDVPADTYRHTLGARAAGKVAGLGYSVDAWYQTGSLGGAAISAYMAALQASYGLDVATKPTFTLWGEILSGDGSAEGAFDTLYATNHKFYGEMDFFLAIPKHTARLGLIDLGGRIAATLPGEVKLNLDLHHFASATPGAGGGSTFGTELNLKAVYTLSPGFTLRALYGLMLPGDVLAEARGLPAGTTPDTEHFAYLTADLSF